MSGTRGGCRFMAASAFSPSGNPMPIICIMGLKLSCCCSCMTFRAACISDICCASAMGFWAMLCAIIAWMFAGNAESVLEAGVVDDDVGVEGAVEVAASGGVCRLSVGCSG